MGSETPDTASQNQPFEHKVAANPKDVIGPPMSPASTMASTNTTVVKPKESSEHPSTAGRTSRPASISSLTFKAPGPRLPQGRWRGRPGRVKEHSPPPQRFNSHISFDSVPAGDATKNNTASVVLNSKHKGYQPNRHSRTFMVGLDDHAYSDNALDYVINELVDDGDFIVCVRVVEREVRAIDPHYKREAQVLMNKITNRPLKGPSGEKNADPAIKITLEYAVGKLHTTFQRLIQVYQPGMLVVGTKGRSGGFQGLMGTRNSFSKYCLQYSPVPVIVVRPEDQREKKKKKREADPSRRSYADMIQKVTGGKHEADSENSSMYELQAGHSQEEEAHKVAVAMGLPAEFDPTIKRININATLSPYSQVGGPKHSGGPMSPNAVAGTSSVAGDSGEEDEASGEEEEEEEFEAMTGDQLLARQQALEQKQQKDKLHEMEMDEAYALRKRDDDAEDDEDDDSGADKKPEG